jgi:hypothetical protein
MANVDIAKKYSNFTAPRTQIFVNEQDIREKYGIAVSSAVIEEASGSKAKFSFSIEDPKCQWIKSEFFTLNSLVQIRMGYENALETVINGEIASVKSIFPARGPPQIEVSGDTNEAHAAARPVNNSSSYSLAYGRTLYSFTSTTNAEEEKIIHKASTTKVQTSNVHCIAECVGFPDIKPGEMVVLAGLATRFNQTYKVEKVTHSIDSSGYRIRFEAEMKKRRK